MSYEEEKQSDAAIAHETWARYTYMRDNGHYDYVKKAMKCEDFFEGLQWDKADLNVLKQQKRPAMTINKIISTVSNVMGEQIFNRTEIAFKPKKEGANEATAEALTKVYMHISDNNHLPWVRSDVFSDGIISGRGFYDVRLDFSDSLTGEIRVTQLNPKNVLIDPDADTYDPDGWSDVVVSKWMSPDMIAILYGEDKAKQLNVTDGAGYYPYGADSIDSERDRFGMPRTAAPYGGQVQGVNASMRWVRVIERQYKVLTKREFFVDISTGDMREVPSEWKPAQVKEHLMKFPNLTTIKKLAQRIRWCVVAGSVVLHDDWSPYKRFTVVPYFPYFRRGRTIGLVENLIGPQEQLNKITSQELHVVNTMANSGWIVKTGELTNMDIAELQERGAQTGLVIEVKNGPGEAIEKITPNQVPTGLDRLSYKAEEAIKSISGVSDYMTGNPREDVAAKAVKANKASGSTNLAKPMDSLARTDHLLARTILDLVQEFMTEPQVLRITTDLLTSQTEELAVNEPQPTGDILNDLTMGEYDVVVTTQPERDTFEDTQFEQALMLRTEAGVAIPDDVIIKASRLKDKAEIVRRLRADTDSPEAQEKAAMARQAQIAEVRRLTAEAGVAEAEIGLTQAKAKAEQAKGEGGMEAEFAKIQLEHQLEIEKMKHEFALEEMKMAQQLKLKKMEAEIDMKIKLQESENNMAVQRATVAMQAKQQAQQAKSKPAAKKTGK